MQADSASTAASRETAASMRSKGAKTSRVARGRIRMTIPELTNKMDVERRWCVQVSDAAMCSGRRGGAKPSWRKTGVRRPNVEACDHGIQNSIVLWVETGKKVCKKELTASTKGKPLKSARVRMRSFVIATDSPVPRDCTVPHVLTTCLVLNRKQNP